MEANDTKGNEKGGGLTRQVVVGNQHGLHARPAGKLAQIAQGFKSSISIIHEEQEVDAKSILDILTLAVGEGSALKLRAVGADAAEALDRIEELFVKRFQEES